MAKGIKVSEREIERRLNDSPVEFDTAGRPVGRIRAMGRRLGVAMLQHVLVDRKADPIKVLKHGNFMVRCWLDKRGDVIGYSAKRMHYTRAGISLSSENDGI